MTDHAPQEDEKIKPAGPVTEVNETHNSESTAPVVPVDDREDETRRKEEGQEMRAEREEIKRTQSHATDASGLTRTTTGTSLAPKSKPWYKQPNPLRWGKTPPVPKERAESREYHAGFWSRLTFQWMAPLMNVSCSSW